MVELLLHPEILKKQTKINKDILRSKKRFEIEYYIRALSKKFFVKCVLCPNNPTLILFLSYVLVEINHNG